MAQIDTLFVTKIYRAELAGDRAERLNAELEAACLSIAEDDEAGQRWCAKNSYPGYTSYASLNDLPWRVPVFGELLKALNAHVTAYAKELEFDLKGRKLVIDSLWINILPPGGVHTSHIHPHSVVSGTYYVTVPEGASALKLEDPRLGFMMAAPPRKAKAKPENRQFAYMKPNPGTVLLWESWLRHEVPVNEAESERISISFNYNWQ
ncbi:TIGR02466 family protein [Microvirga aerophila]|uniref:2OG-Fe(II) oxygenase-related protein n=1 Tax=Microvirga aerophila TaxID=670291 RepID=A0A512BXQ3_9HYPH|nr:TIGR02466 family protein [Microvirga aerophila]GEO16731.1 2OG-Fe(II) oxygenase-related protein [Microvirga aerophila]